MRKKDHLPAASSAAMLLPLIFFFSIKHDQGWNGKAINTGLVGKMEVFTFREPVANSSRYCVFFLTACP
jgi:hypothetical protein